MKSNVVVHDLIKEILKNFAFILHCDVQWYTGEVNDQYVWLVIVLLALVDRWLDGLWWAGVQGHTNEPP